MKLAGEYDYRNAKAILKATAPDHLAEIYTVLEHVESTLDLTSSGESQRQLSSQLKKWFVAKGWKEEQPAFSVPGMQYDLLKDRVPIEIEIGHERLRFRISSNSWRTIRTATLRRQSWWLQAIQRRSGIHGIVRCAVLSENSSP